MGHRLSRIYTRTGDDGSTSLGDGSRVSKQDPRIAAIGSLDETNCWIGRLLCELPAAETGQLHARLIDIQQRLFDAGGELSIPGHSIITDEEVTRLEIWIDEYNKDLPPLKNFVLPRGSSSVTSCHLARAVSRRAELACMAVASPAAGPALLAWINRLSDFLFVLARALNLPDGNREILWQQKSV